MPRYDSVLLDLDGTVTDSAPGILDSVEYALKKYGFTDYSREDLYFFVGPPLIDSFEALLGCSHADAERCLGYYREYYPVTGMFNNSVYPGVAGALTALRRAGVKTVLATAKPEVFARRILDHFGLTGLFDGIHGATLGEGRNRKSQVIAWALEHTPERGRAVMVGDRADDVKGALANGIDVLGALWGYGGETELRTAGADMIFNSIKEVTDYVVYET